MTPAAVRENGPALAASLVLAAGAKAAYPRLGPDELRVLTTPIQAVVGLLTGIGFTWESGYGYVSFADRLVIAKSCTGVNFLLAAFGLLAFTVIPAAGGARVKLALVPLLAACAYAATVAVNSVRIALGVALHDGGVAWGWLDAARVHRLTGILVYLTALVALHAAGRAALRPWPAPHVPSPVFVAPLAAYGIITVAVPLANGALAANPRLFVEHCLWIAAVGALGVAAVRFARRAGIWHASGANSVRTQYER